VRTPQERRSKSCLQTMTPSAHSRTCMYVPMEVEVVVAESSARRRPRIPQGVDFERAGLQLRAINQTPAGRSEQARSAPPHRSPGGSHRVARQKAPLACVSLQAQAREGLDEKCSGRASRRFRSVRDLVSWI
jgi:hypothetical protein